MKNMLPKMPKFEQALPKMAKLPNPGMEYRRLQGHFGLLGRQWGKFGNTMRPTKTNGGKPDG